MDAKWKPWGEKPGGGGKSSDKRRDGKLRTSSSTTATTTTGASSSKHEGSSYHFNSDSGGGAHAGRHASRYIGTGTGASKLNAQATTTHHKTGHKHKPAAHNTGGITATKPSGSAKDGPKSLYGSHECPHGYDYHHGTASTALTATCRCCLRKMQDEHYLDEVDFRYLHERA